MDFANNCVEWLLAIQNKKVELPKDFIDEKIKKIFAMADTEKDSGQ